MKAVRTIDLDAERDTGYVFAADGKSFRTLTTVRGVLGKYDTILVREVSAETGKEIKKLVQVDGPFVSIELSPDGRKIAFIREDRDRFEVWDAESGEVLRSQQFPVKEPNGKPFGESQKNSVRFAPDGRSVAVFTSRAVRLFDLSTGEWGTAMKADGILFLTPPANPFGDRGRLLAAGGFYVPPPPPPDGQPQPGGRQTNADITQVIWVWDGGTGRILKEWGGRGGLRSGAIPIAPHPTAPVLATLETNGKDGVRLGLWDFSAEE